MATTTPGHATATWTYTTSDDTQTATIEVTPGGTAGTPIARITPMEDPMTVPAETEIATRFAGREVPAHYPLLDLIQERHALSARDAHAAIHAYAGNHATLCPHPRWGHSAARPPGPERFG